MPQVLLSLGGNVGPVAETFRKALQVLATIPETSVKSISTLHTTSAVGVAGTQTGEYVNAAAELSTTCLPLELLNSLQAIEQQFDRRRDERWGSRPLDLDLLFYGDITLEIARLTVPHRSAWYRRFVLDPLVEIAPDFNHPLKQCTIRQLRERILVAPLTIGLAGPDAIRVLSEWNGPELTNGRFTLSLWNPSDTVPTFIVWCGADDDPAFEQLPVVPRIMPHEPATSPAQFLRILIASALG